jgi:hypothetical protein
MLKSMEMGTGYPANSNFAETKIALFEPAGCPMFCEGILSRPQEMGKENRIGLRRRRATGEETGQEIRKGSHRAHSKRGREIKLIECLLISAYSPAV